eukprot:gene19214-21138_t
MSAANSKKKNKSELSQEQIIMKFNQLRQEQRMLANKFTELEMDVGEHNTVIDTLKSVDGERKCFRSVGGVLVERTVKDVLPALENNKAQIQNLLEKLEVQLRSKGEELVKFKEEHNIKLKGEREPMAANKDEAQTKASSGVLVTK